MSRVEGDPLAVRYLRFSDACLTTGPQQVIMTYKAGKSTKFNRNWPLNWLSAHILSCSTPLGKLVTNGLTSHFAEGVFADAANLILRSNAEVKLAYLPKPNTRKPRANMPKPASAALRLTGLSRSEWDVGKGSTAIIHLLASSIQLAEGSYCSNYRPPFHKRRMEGEEKRGKI